jgi:hypothetical protein
MTKDRARKRAARDRAAATGERYVVANRQVGTTQQSDDRGLHGLTHRVPGVPDHVDGGLQARARKNPAARPAHQGTSNHGEPRVLVGWQNRIAPFFGAK